jgi:hypothetical protein
MGVVLTKFSAQFGGQIFETMGQANEVIFVTGMGVRSGEADQSESEGGRDKCEF